MSSGLIYFAVIALWVAYFLPRWLRSHDETSENKNLERFREAMHVVSIGSSMNTYLTRTEIAEREARALRKRQIILFALVIFLLTNFVVAVINIVPFKSLLLPTSLLLIYVVHVRRQKVQDDVNRRRRIAAMKGKGSGYNFSDITYRPVEGEASQWIPIDHSTTVTIIRNDSWKPSDLPLPTYVTAPKAPARPVINRELYDQESAPLNSEESIPGETIDQVFDQEDVSSERKAANE